MRSKYIVFGASNITYGTFDEEEDARECFCREVHNLKNIGDTIRMVYRDDLICESQVQA